MRYYNEALKNSEGDKLAYITTANAFAVEQSAIIHQKMLEEYHLQLMKFLTKQNE